MSLSKLIESLIFIGSLCLFFFPEVHSQKQDTSLTIRTIDMRGQKTLKSTYAAIKASEGDVVVVYIRGGSEELINKSKAQLRALVHNGYTRVGVVLGDLGEKEEGPVIGFLVNALIYAVIKKAEVNTITGWEVYNLVRDAYQEHIWPKMNKTGNGNKP